MSTSLSPDSAVIPDAQASPELAALRAHATEMRAFTGALSLLGWDEKTKLPPKGAAFRATQKSVLAGLLHEKGTAPAVVRLIEAVENTDPGNREAKVARRGYEMSTKLPNAFVRELTQVSSEAGHAWQQARADNNFPDFAPYLENVVRLCREKAELLGYENERYDALVDIYEEGVTAAELAPIFEGLRVPIHELLALQPEADTAILERRYPVDAQMEYSHHIVEQIGFDLDAGRIDETAHPFCAQIGVGDVRLTTRFDEHWLPGSVFAAMHEAGHGIYEQAFHRLKLPATIAGAPGLGMHESQSRMYENIVGRSKEFWGYHFAHLQKTFPDALTDVSLDDFHRSINSAKSTLIRVEADELTYNLHVGLRFELERQLMNGELEVAELRDAWNAGMERWVGVVPETDDVGVLQDVHWSMAGFGYFPTYTLGNVYSSQFVEVLRSDIPDLDDQIAAGNIKPLADWFDTHVYQWGCMYTGRELVGRITGGPISVDPLVRYLRGKYQTL